ncbi:MAG TPA: NAD(P)/FAD-dependent oxidoreductase [Candidatus Limiplasma sp.]|nr:NAD(P)/FAD-dependent oxidoreductase [Candidatus Limiplasma sp.]
MSDTVVVVGGGAAGLMAATQAARQGHTVLLLERGEKLGKKIYITGKGRCNVTNLCTPEAFMRNVVRNPKFLFSALRALPPQKLIELLRELGCPTTVERGNRVFPVSQKASDVTRAFTRAIESLGVQVRLNARVKELLTADGAITGVALESGETIAARAVIVCTGGVSYPTTGSTGDGYELLQALGHTMAVPKAALCGLISEDAWIRSLQGLSLKNVRLNLWDGKKHLMGEIGEMLFTHRGISGPLVLTASSLMAGRKGLQLALDLKPGLTEEQLDARLLRDLADAGKKQMITILRGLYPGDLATIMAQLADISPQLPACELPKAARQRLVSLTKALPLPVTGAEPIETAVITAGGADVKEFNPSTMESKLVKGLYAAGEVLDVDALTGGFNLHIAFCTGYLAASSL